MNILHDSKFHLLNFIDFCYFLVPNSFISFADYESIANC